MRQLQYISPSLLEWHDVPEPKLSDSREALVQPLVVSRCELDRFIALGALGWPGGFAFGHEIYGEVIAVGDAVTNFQPGDRVLVPFQISCGVCGRCRQGHTALCESVPYRSSYGMAPLSGLDYGGGLSDLVKVPYANHMLVNAPTNIDPTVIAGVTDTMTTAYAMVIEGLNAYPNSRVLVVGGNIVALNVVRYALGLGADAVVLVDADAGALQIAARLGAEPVHAEDAKTNMLGTFPITIDATGTEQGLALAIYATAREGLCQSSYGGISDTTPVPLKHMYGTNIRLQIGRVHARHHMPAALDLIKTGCVHSEPIASHKLPFSEAPEAMLEAAHGMVFVPD